MSGRAMMYKAYAAFLMWLGVALTIASNQASGGARVVHGGVSASPHSHSMTFHRSFARLHHRGRHRGDFFPGSFFWGPYDQPNVDIPPPISGPASNDVTYTYKMDVPWDWAHRFPPSFFANSNPEPASPPVAYVPGCAKQVGTCRGAGGEQQTVNT